MFRSRGSADCHRGLHSHRRPTSAAAHHAPTIPVSNGPIPTPVKSSAADTSSITAPISQALMSSEVPSVRSGGMRQRRQK